MGKIRSACLIEIVEIDAFSARRDANAPSLGGCLANLWLRHLVAARNRLDRLFIRTPLFIELGLRPDFRSMLVIGKRNGDVRPSGRPLDEPKFDFFDAD